MLLEERRLVARLRIRKLLHVVGTALHEFIHPLFGEPGALLAGHLLFLDSIQLSHHWRLVSRAIFLSAWIEHAGAGSLNVLLTSGRSTHHVIPEAVESRCRNLGLRESGGHLVLGLVFEIEFEVLLLGDRLVQLTQGLIEILGRVDILEDLGDDAHLGSKLVALRTLLPPLLRMHVLEHAIELLDISRVRCH